MKLYLETFQGYDWLDPSKNTKHHGDMVPPMYNLSKVTTPVALYWGDNDWYTAKQVSRLILFIYCSSSFRILNLWLLACQIYGPV